MLLAGFLPFHEENIVLLYRKIHRGDFRCPPWISSDARRLIVKMLDPNPNTRITISKIMQTSWMKKAVPRSIEIEEEKGCEGKQIETLNAFHIISLSQGFDLSPLFEYKKSDEREEMRFATTKTPSSLISKLEEVANSAKFSVKKSDSSVRLQGFENERKGKLGIAAEMFELAPSLMVVEVKKCGGDTLEYNQFCSKELRPALKDIIWTSKDSDSRSD